MPIGDQGSSQANDALRPHPPEVREIPEPEVPPSEDIATQPKAFKEQQDFTKQTPTDWKATALQLLHGKVFHPDGTILVRELGIIAICFVWAYAFIQDNGSKQLSSPALLKAFVEKCLTVAVLMLALLISYRLLAELCVYLSGLKWGRTVMRLGGVMFVAYSFYKGYQILLP